MTTDDIWAGADDADRVTTITLQIAWRSDEGWDDPALWDWPTIVESYPVRVVTSETVER